MDPRQPVIVGVAQHTNRARDLERALEPLAMMELVARQAAEDAGRPDLLGRLDSLLVVNIISWPYEDAPGLLARRLGIEPPFTYYSGIGGETPQRLVNQVCARILEGRTRLALIVGAEAMHSFMAARRQGVHLPWTPRAVPRRIDEDVRPGNSELEGRYGCNLPIRVYPLFENALRAHLGLSLEEHRQRLGVLCARMTQVAVGNPYAWFPVARSPEEITSVSPQNRMICFPYPKLMNAIMEVDQAAALLVTSVEAARELGVPEERWVYIWSGAHLADRWHISERPCYHRSLAQELALQRALELAGLRPDDVDMFDLYSCFPSAVQTAMEVLGIGLDDPRPITLTGGLPYAGGPGNNYCSHSIAAAVERLRREPDRKALISGMGWYFTKHSAGVYSGRPPQRPYRPYDPAPDAARIEAQEAPPLVEEAEGPATVETYTVIFGRDGEPEEGIVIGRLGDGKGPRFLANTGGDRELLWSMCRQEMVGVRGRVRRDPSGKNLFSL
ncbi:MAG TPA: acetyl-CoA acetyltransferase [Dehalococcoidia bacterium]|nr:acetyl-CoA acetyltransferase [Dehalococcoidia bacterium]